jgi:RNA polymerase sigma factor (sigma-70 family)
MCGETERSPALAAPGSNNYTGLIASSTTETIGAKASKVQGLSDDDANDLCERYKPLAFKIAGQYRNRGVELDELRAAGLLGLVQASRRFDPERDIAFGGYAQHWIKGQILELFKPKADAIGFGRAESLNAPANTEDDEEGTTQLDFVIDESLPGATLDVGEMSERERCVFRARLDGETLDDIAKGIGISRERVRQINERATHKIGSTPGNVARACIRDLWNRRGYRRTARSQWAGGNLGPVKQIKITQHLSGPEKQRWSECLKSAETTVWSRRTDGRDKRFKVDGSISWKRLTPDQVERAKQKTSEEHLHKFLTHHLLERFRFDMRAKLCGGTKVNRPRKGSWCRRALVSPGPKRDTRRGVIIRFPVERTRRSKGFCDREPPKHVYHEPETSRKIVHHRVHASRLAASRGGKSIRNARGPYGGPIIHQGGRS